MGREQLAAVASGGFVMAGGGSEPWLRVLDDEGTVLLDQSYPGPGTALFSILEAADGLVLAGRNRVIRTDLSGAPLWDWVASDAWLLGAAEHAEGGFVFFGIAGRRDGGSALRIVRTVVHVNDSGEVVWEREDPAVGHNRAGGATALSLPDGFVFTTSGAHVVRTDLEGATVWIRDYGSTGDSFFDALALPDGGLLFAGTGVSEHRAAWLLRTDADGEVIWERFYGTSDVGPIYAVAHAPGGGFVLASTAFNDAWVIGTDEEGVQQWAQSVDLDGHEIAAGLQVTASGTITVVGSSDESGPPGRNDAWVLRVTDPTALACVTWPVTPPSP